MLIYCSLLTQTSGGLNMIYVPDTNYACYVVINSDTIRAYSSIPRLNGTSYYRDYYLNSNYIYQDGSQSWGSYGTLPTCLNSSKITNEVYYRNDFDSILIIFLIMCIFCFYIPLKIFSKLFKRGGL